MTRLARWNVSIFFAMFALSGGCESSSDGGGGKGEAGTDDAGSDSGALDCSGSEETLSCTHPDARSVLGAKYDATRDCFYPRAKLADYCAVPTFCPGGDGEIVCVIAPSGEAFIVYLRHGEETTKPEWHQGGGFRPSTLTEAETEVCEALLETYSDAYDVSTQQVVDDRLLSGDSSDVQVRPQCD